MLDERGSEYDLAGDFDLHPPASLLSCHQGVLLSAEPHLGAGTSVISIRHVETDSEKLRSLPVGAQEEAELGFRVRCVTPKAKLLPGLQAIFRKNHL